MQPDEAKQFGALFADVMAYYRQDTSDFTRSLFWSALTNFSLAEVQSAFEAHAKNPEKEGRFAPMVSDLVKILQGSTTDRAALAWGKTLDAMIRIGAYTDIVFDDPAIHATVEDLGGWPKVCRTEIAELSYLQHRFQQSHRAYTERRTFDYPRRLPGERSPDEEFERKGLRPPPVALVGDPARCHAVFEGGGEGKTSISYVAMTDLAMRNLPAIGGVQ